MDDSSIWLALFLTTIAGLSTGIGGLIAFGAKSTDERFLSFSLGLSAGVMVYVSFMEMMPMSVELLSKSYASRMAELYMLLSFFAGIALIAIIDRLVPEDENPHEMQGNSKSGKMPLKRTGVMMALAIGIHNFPEGLATFASSMTQLDVAVPIVVAVAIHNIPEGIAVSVPIFHATGSKKKALKYSFLSGLAEPVGGLVGFMLLMTFWTPTVNALLLAFVSGIMIYISFDELLPGTERYGHHHCGIGGVVCGMAVMAASLLLL